MGEPEKQGPEPTVESAAMLDEVEIRFLRGAVNDLRALTKLRVDDAMFSDREREYIGDSVESRVADFSKTINLLERVSGNEVIQEIVKGYESLLRICGVYDTYRQTHYPYQLSSNFQRSHYDIVAKARKEDRSVLEFYDQTDALRKKIWTFANQLEKVIEEVDTQGGGEPVPKPPVEEATPAVTGTEGGGTGGRKAKGQRESGEDAYIGFIKAIELSSGILTRKKLEKAIKDGEPVKVRCDRPRARRCNVHIQDVLALIEKLSADDAAGEKADEMFSEYKEAFQKKREENINLD
jgi:hypothetical protein